MTKKKKKGVKPVPKEGWCTGVSRDIKEVLKHSIDKGQLLPAGFVLSLLLLAVKMDSPDIKEVALEVVSLTADGSLLGWGIAIVAIVAGVRKNKQLRMENDKECDRVGRIKTELQKKELETIEADIVTDEKTEEKES